ncbi:MAG: 16S rRNA (adenine(1518)-N(6)/adenine(1519)-N(6)) -dimethyltransferase RsmA [Calditrichia bacterium]
MNPAKSNYFQRKRLSQNFLKDFNIARKIVSAISIPNPVVAVEIGAGQGILTRFLTKRVPRVIAIEIDSRLAESLAESLNNPANLKVISQDVLKLDFEEILPPEASRGAVIIGNLPYHITSPILFKLFDSASIIQQAVLMVQKEVGDRLVAAPGSKIYGILSVVSQFYAEVEYLFTVPAHLFHPAPRVDSAVMRLTFGKKEVHRGLDPELFRTIVRLTFNQRRKMLRNTLSRIYPQPILSQLKFDLSRRPESLSVDEFIELTNQISQAQNREAL